MKKSPLSRTQLKTLEGILNNLRSAAYSAAYDDDKPEPPAVVRARKIVEEYETKQRQKYDARREVIRRDVERARLQMIFGASMDEVLAPLKALAKKYGLDDPGIGL